MTLWFLCSQVPVSQATTGPTFLDPRAKSWFLRCLPRSPEAVPPRRPSLFRKGHPSYSWCGTPEAYDRALHQGILPSANQNIVKSLLHWNQQQGLVGSSKTHQFLLSFQIKRGTHPEIHEILALRKCFSIPPLGLDQLQAFQMVSTSRSFLFHRLT